MIDYEEYFYMKENIIYKIVILKNNSEITFECKSYKISYNLKDLSILFKREFDTIDNAYEFIINIFEENNFSVNNIVKNKNLDLHMKIGNNIIIKIVLIYNKQNKNFILNEINELKNEINALKKEADFLRKENKKLDGEIKKLKPNNIIISL